MGVQIPERVSVGLIVDVVYGHAALQTCESRGVYFPGHVSTETLTLDAYLMVNAVYGCATFWRVANHEHCYRRIILLCV